MKLAELFTDGIVFQRDMPIRVFGTGKGEGKVVFLGEEVSFTNAADGKWVVELPPKAFGSGYEMQIWLNGERHTLRNVSIGDVWLLGGQSNMEMPLFRARQGFEIAKNCADENIHFYTVPRRYTKGVSIYNYHFDLANE